MWDSRKLDLKWDHIMCLFFILQIVFLSFLGVKTFRHCMKAPPSLRFALSYCYFYRKERTRHPFVLCCFIHRICYELITCLSFRSFLIGGGGVMRTALDSQQSPWNKPWSCIFNYGISSYETRTHRTMKHESINNIG